MTWYTVGWVVIFLQFLALEGAALSNRSEGDTLSEHIWKWAAIKGKPTGWKARRAALVTTLAWLVSHLLSGGWV